MKPPKATGERQEIYSVLEEKANYQLTLRYPKAGEYRSAIVMKDVTGDGNDEAINFTPEGKIPIQLYLLLARQRVFGLKLHPIKILPHRLTEFVLEILTVTESQILQLVGGILQQVPVN